MPTITPDQRRAKARNISLMLRIIAVVVLVGGGAASWFLFFSPNHSNSPFFDRHGLPDSVPLPDGLVNFTPIKDFHYYSAQGTTVKVQGWAWGVEATTPAQIVQFYQDHLPGKGWTHLKTMTTLQGGTKSVYACQGRMLLIIDADARSLAFADDQGHLSSMVTAPSGGSVLGISRLSGDLSLMDTDCAAAA